MASTNNVLQDFIAVCVVLVATETIGRLCPKNSMLNFVRGLTVLVLLISTALPLFSAEWTASVPMQQSANAGEELSEYIQTEIMQAAESEFAEYLRGLLEAAGMKAEKIEVTTDIGDDGCIVLTKAKLVFKFENECERARVLLKTTLTDAVEVEVQTNGRR